MELTTSTSTRNLLRKKTLYKRDSLNGNLIYNDENNANLTPN